MGGPRQEVPHRPEQLLPSQARAATLFHPSEGLKAGWNNCVVVHSTASPSSGPLLTTLLTWGPLGRSPFLKGPGQGIWETAVGLGYTADELHDLNFLCPLFPHSSLSYLMLKVCLPIQELPV